MEILSTSYTCKQKMKDKSYQRKRVQNECETKEKCQIPASREFFGFGECRRAKARKMRLRISYRCNAGGKDHTSILKEVGSSKCK